MNGMRRFALATAAVSFATLGLLPIISAAAAPSAGASVIPAASGLPAGCSYTDSVSDTFETQALKCTKLAKNEVWRQEATCLVFPGPKYFNLNGNQVTGNGTSSITCNGTLSTPTFFEEG